MNTAYDFSFLNELRADDAKLQNTIQTAYAHAVNAETEFDVNPDQFLSATRKACLYLARSLSTAFRITVNEPDLLASYCGRDSSLYSVFGEDIIQKIRYIDGHASFSGIVTAEEQKRILRQLQLLGADVCRRLGGKVPEEILNEGITFKGIRKGKKKEQAFSKKGFTEDTARAITNKFFKETEEDRAAEEEIWKTQDPILKDTVDEINRKVGSMLRDLEQISLQTDKDKALNQESIKELNKKLDDIQKSVKQGMQNYRIEHERQMQQVLEEYKNVVEMLNKTSAGNDDLIASVAELRRLVDRLTESRQQEDADISRKTVDVGDSVKDFIENNRGRISQLPPQAAEFIKKLVRTGSECVSTGKKYAAEAVETARQAYEEAKNSSSKASAVYSKDEKISHKRSAGSAGQKQARSRERVKTSGTISPMNSVTGFINRFILSKEAGIIYRRLVLFNVISIITWLVVLILFYTRDTASAPRLLSKFLALVWYFISWYSGFMGMIILIAGILRSLLEVYIQKRKGVQLKQTIKRRIRHIIYILLLYFATAYIHSQFYPIISSGVGWKQILTLKDPSQIHQIFEWVVEIWRMR